MADLARLDGPLQEHSLAGKLTAGIALKRCDRPGGPASATQGALPVDQRTRQQSTVRKTVVLLPLTRPAVPPG